MDKKLLLLLYNSAQKNKAVSHAFIIFSEASSKIFFFAYIAVGISVALNSTDGLMRYILTPALTLATTFALRKLCRRARPYTELAIDGLLGEKHSFSFPSNHSASSAAIALAISSIYSPLGIVLLIFAFLTGMSRIVTGTHYPSDVLAGWSLAAAFTLLTP